MEQEGVSAQLELFAKFITNDSSEVTNTIERWDNIPRYFFTPALVESLRNEDGLANPHEWFFEDDGLPCCIVTQPAILKVKNDEGEEVYKAFFPGVTEEMIEEILKKSVTDKKELGLHDPVNVETWVQFTLSMLYNELRKRKRSRSFNEIKHAINVMSSCVIVYYRDGSEVWRGSILQDLVTVGRKEYLEDTSKTHLARLPIFISHSINKLEYRQINYNRLMLLKGDLSRWIYRKLVNRFKQASYSNSYHFKYSTTKMSGLLQQSTESRNRSKVVSALNELKKSNVISNYTTSPIMEGNKIVDVVYEVFPGIELITDQKAANKRTTDGMMQAKNLGLIHEMSEV